MEQTKGLIAEYISIMKSLNEFNQKEKIFDNEFRKKEMEDIQRDDEIGEIARKRLCERMKIKQGYYQRLKEIEDEIEK